MKTNPTLNQQELLTQQDLRKKLPAIPKIVPDPGMKTSLVTQVVCESEGGLFTLQFAELRPVEPHTDQVDRFDGNSAFVVVGRYALSPVALIYLKNAIAQAEQFHIAHFGELPDVHKFASQLLTELPARPIPSDARVGFRRESTGQQN